MNIAKRFTVCLSITASVIFLLPTSFNPSSCLFGTEKAYSAGASTSLPGEIVIGTSRVRALLDPNQILGGSASISLRVGRKVSGELAAWITGSLREGYATRDGMVQLCESKTSMTSSTFDRAHLSKVTFPRLDANDNSTAYYDVTLTSPSVKTRRGACSDASLISGSVVPFGRRDFTLENTIGFPPAVSFFRVSEITWQQIPVLERSTSRTGSTVVDWRSSISQVTFECAGNKNDLEAVFHMFKTYSQGSMMSGTITINLVDSNYGESFASIKLSGLKLMSYSPFISLNVDDPATPSFSFTVVPGSIQFNAK